MLRGLLKNWKQSSKMEKRTQYQHLPKTQVSQFRFLLRYLVVFRKGGKKSIMVLLIEGYFIQLRCFFGHCLQRHNYGCFFCYQLHSFESQVCVHFSYFSVYCCHLTLAACVCQLRCASLRRRGCFVNVMSLAALLVLSRPNKTGSQAEPSLCELCSRRAFEC